MFELLSDCNAIDLNHMQKYFYNLLELEMVETVAPKEDEPITSEEVVNLGEDLVENQKNPA